jgi:type VI protein secretion system component VasF
MTDADVWEQAEHDALLAQHSELVRNERAMVRVLVKVSIGLMAIVLASAWLWMRLTGRS